MGRPLIRYWSQTLINKEPAFSRVLEGFANYSSSLEFPLLLNLGTTIHKIPTTFV